MSICFNCKNAYAHKCKWVHSLTPIPGWTAVKRDIKYKEGPISTYNVKRCPNFVPDGKIYMSKEARNKRIIELAKNSDLSIRKIAGIVGVSDFTVAKTLRRNAPRMRRCAKCGKEFTMRGNNRQCDDCKRKAGCFTA